MPSNDRHINFALMRDRILANQNGKEYWRSLEELADTPEFQEFVEREYPQHAEEWHDPFSRRTFIKLMGASLALAGLSSCVYQPAEKIVPYVTQPEEMIPGRPLYFATAMPMSGGATPLLVRSNDGRPTKVDGNPDHPNNRNGDANDKGTSATDIFAQASVLTLYDPDRSQTLTYREEIRPWTAFVADMNTALEDHKKDGGAGLRFLTEMVTSPTLASQLRAILTTFSNAKWHQYEPAGSNAQAGATAAFGESVNTIYHFDQAERILAIDSDFLACGPGSLRYARDFSAKRRVTEENKTMNRLYVIESTPTNTGAMADHNLRLRPSEIEGFTRAVANALGAAGVNVNTGNASNGQLYTAHSSWINALAVDLKDFQGRSLIIVGNEQSPAVHALAHAINSALGNFGKTITFTEPIAARVEDHTQSLRDLVSDIDGGRVQTLIILGGNPVYTTPADLKLDQSRMDKIKLRVHLSLYKDETSELCHWNIPETHYLEAWSDTRAYDGTVSIIQPLIAPLYDGKSVHELLAVFQNQFDRKGYDIVRAFWQGEMGGGNKVAAATIQGPDFANKSLLSAPLLNATTDFEMAWRKAVHDGFISNTAAKPKEGLTIKGSQETRIIDVHVSPGNASPTPNLPTPASGFEIVFRTDPTIYDGRFSNNGWLQELPKPANTLTWDNAALISPATARQLGINNKIGGYGGDVFVDTVKITNAGRSVVAPVWITPGHPDNVVTVHLGYGRTRAGRVGTGKGFNAYSIRTADSPWFGSGVKVEKTNEQFALAVTQLHHLMENRDIVRVNNLTDYLKDPEKIHEQGNNLSEEESRDDSMYPQYNYTERDYDRNYAWGMAIDVNSCVGCNACIVACQSENNIPVVGKEQVQRGREMHWIRVDSYFKGPEDNPEGPYFMPVPCMHCENAPCEPVCPVHATVHSAEGLNDMVYNRCVGTRYCSNNCPYKVRRFNFLLYQDWETPTYQLMRNPEVTVRSRGVMEKCTYCIQRIQWGKIEAEKEDRVLKDGEIVTACQAVCPTEAIVFGNINDPNSRVAKLKKEERNYSLLADLNTRPRTTYLSRLRNPNEKITEKA
jgi:MoCo/4Fe-4S cofactor protein with predicted Tat translocation signal